MVPQVCAAEELAARQGHGGCAAAGGRSEPRRATSNASSARWSRSSAPACAPPTWRGIAEFFSFGTNDLTQATFSFSREDAENKFLPQYIESGVLPHNPFEMLDVDGVGRLMRLAVEWGRSARPDLVVGICGEHGGQPEAIRFCHDSGLDYVSCSAPRVPIARLAAAQAALKAREAA